MIWTLFFSYCSWWCRHWYIESFVKEKSLSRPALILQVCSSSSVLSSRSYKLATVLILFIQITRQQLLRWVLCNKLPGACMCVWVYVPLCEEAVGVSMNEERGNKANSHFHMQLSQHDSSLVVKWRALLHPISVLSNWLVLVPAPSDHLLRH